jgi:hypothetical protein
MWDHNLLLHPIKYLRDSYWLEKKHYLDRPYPVTSPAFTDVPLVGPLLAATIGVLPGPVGVDPFNIGNDSFVLTSRY